MADRYNADWTDASKQYQTSVGAVTSHTSFELVDMATALAPFDADSTVVDVGCGPGPVTLAIVAQAPNTRVEAIDTSQKMLDDLSTNITNSEKDILNVKTRLVDIHDLESTYGTAAFSHVFASLVLHVASEDYSATTKQIYQILKPGGIFAFASFTPHADPYLIWDRVCRVYDPDYELAPWATDLKAWATPGEVAAGLQKAGFVDIKSVVRRNKFPIDTVQGWVDFFFDGKNPAGERIQKPFFETHEVSTQDVKKTFATILQEEWDGGKNVLAEFTLAVGRKP